MVSSAVQCSGCRRCVERLSRGRDRLHESYRWVYPGVSFRFLNDSLSKRSTIKVQSSFCFRYYLLVACRRLVAGAMGHPKIHTHTCPNMSYWQYCECVYVMLSKWHVCFISSQWSLRTIGASERNIFCGQEVGLDELVPRADTWAHALPTPSSDKRCFGGSRYCMFLRRASICTTR